MGQGHLCPHCGSECDDVRALKRLLPTAESLAKGVLTAGQQKHFPPEVIAAAEHIVAETKKRPLARYLVAGTQPGG